MEESVCVDMSILCSPTENSAMPSFPFDRLLAGLVEDAYKSVERWFASTALKFGLYLHICDLLIAPTGTADAPSDGKLRPPDANANEHSNE